MYIYTCTCICIYIYICMYVSEHKQNAQNTKRWKQSSAVKQLLETVLLAIKICTDFNTSLQMIYGRTVSLANDITAEADAFHRIRTHQR